MTGSGEFSELHAELRDVTRSMLGRGHDEQRTWQEVVDLGWVGLEAPEALDGSGVTFAETAVVLEELGRACTAGPFYGSAVSALATACVVEARTKRDELIRAMVSGAIRGAVALAPSADADRADPSFVLGADGLAGRAESVVDAAGAEVVLLAAVDAHGDVAVVPVHANRLKITPNPVLDETRVLATVEAEGLEVDPADIWPLPGGLTTLQWLLDRGALAIACDSLGLANAMLDETVSYVSQREQFDRPVGSFQAVKHACADMLVELRVGRELIQSAVALVDGDAEVFGIAASRAKAFVTATAVDVVGSALQLHGGIGYTWEHPLHRYLKRAVLNRALLGSPAAHRRRLSSRLVRRRDTGS